ncbi:MAG TPA: formate dehydrogenase subunit beta [Chloroflexi bacterium]|nr:formate dehydrogenase subunit beta [Chloroflexota bacterium]
MAKIAMLIDLSKCMACRSCQAACKEWNDLQAETTTNRGTYENPPDLSANTWTRITFREVAASEGVHWLFFKEQCLHCGEAPCVKVCPTAALKQNELGFVSFEEELCNGCAYCTSFCPFGIPRMNIVNRLTGAATASKCTLCQDRVTAGMAPACVKACPTGALAFGSREEIIARAEERVQALQAGQSASRPNASLYGTNILGGLGVLYVLPEAPESYGLPRNPQVNLAFSSFWQDLLQPLGEVAIGATLVGLGINWVVSRRMARQKEAQDE